MSAAFLALMLLAPAPVRAAGPGDPVLEALGAELARSFSGLRRMHPAPPLYYLSYQALETRSKSHTAVLGAMLAGSEAASRSLDVDVRVGSPLLDNTHEIKGAESAG
ncbi:MAG: hypothetical protein HYV15_07970, partial [Elusimicrobia bacterium]|nr:hypothetical protein [Elusimicrobiota bacterium]